MCLVHSWPRCHPSRPNLPSRPFQHSRVLFLGRQHPTSQVTNAKSHSTRLKIQAMRRWIALPSKYVSLNSYLHSKFSIGTFGQATSEGYKRTRNTRVFLCAASADESGREALDWTLESLVQHGDELIVVRGFDLEDLGESKSALSGPVLTMRYRERATCRD